MFQTECCGVRIYSQHWKAEAGESRTGELEANLGNIARASQDIF